MKKILLTLTGVFVLSTAYAQSDENTNDANTNSSDYNKWSIEFAGGVNKFQRPVTANYYQSTPSFYNADLGVRYMFNNKFTYKFVINNRTITKY